MATPEEVKSLYGIIGYPLSHSFSPRYFAEKFEKENIKDAFYTSFPIEQIEQFPDLISRHQNLVGLNVTIPYKQEVIPYLTSLDETALAVGAVNTIKVDRNGDDTILTGYNTDVYGFELSLKPALKSHHHRALILGTGGASKAVKYVLNKLGIESVYVSRNMDGEGQLTYSELNSHVLKNYLLIVNTTPLGMSPNIDTCPELSYADIGDQHLLYDLVYNPEVTLFMKKGKENGAAVLNGLSMLYYQAEGAWEIWNR